MARPGVTGSTLPAVTCVLAVWDAYVRHLPAALDNLRQQDGVQVRIVVIDNASSVRLPPGPEGVVVVRCNARISLGEARNLGLQHVDTELVAFCDVDDLLLDGALAFLASRCLARPELVACVGSLVRREYDDGASSHWPSSSVRWLAQHRCLMLTLNLFKDLLPMASCSVMRSGACRQAGGLSRLGYGEDWSLINALLARGPIEVHPRHCRFLRRDEVSMSMVVDRREIRLALAEIRGRALQDPATPRAIRCLRPLLATVHAVRVTTIARRHGRARQAISTSIASSGRVS
jgi:glycosyltransferase involved in cell wall biosynthesis